jgi:hypothetical protein
LAFRSLIPLLDYLHSIHLMHESEVMEKYIYYSLAFKG